MFYYSLNSAILPTFQLPTPRGSHTRIFLDGVDVLELRVYVETGNYMGSHGAWLDPYVMTK